MSDEAQEPIQPDVVTAPGDAAGSGPRRAGATDGSPGADGAEKDEAVEAVGHPAKVMRLGTMLKQLLEEVRETALDEGSRERLATIYDTSVKEVGSALSPDLRDELDRLTSPFADDADIPSAAEIRIAKAQLVGWLEGLVQGIQATLFAQQMLAQQQLAQLQQGLPPGSGNGSAEPAPGTYL